MKSLVSVEQMTNASSAMRSMRNSVFIYSDDPSAQDFTSALRINFEDIIYLSRVHIM